MIFNINLGEEYKGEETPWVEEICNGFPFFVRNDINQKIKVYGDTNAPFTLGSWGDGQVLPPNTRWGNNNRTLSSTLVPIRDKKNDLDDSIVYVTVDCTLKLLKYKSNVEILQTYSQKGCYVGCVLVIPPNKLKDKEYNKLIEIYVKNLKTNRLEVIRVSLDPTEARTKVEQEDVANSKLVRELFEIDKMNPNGKKFRYYLHGPKPITNTYFVSNKQEKKIAEDLTKNVKNRKIISIENLSHDEILKVCKEELIDNHIRGFTMIGNTDIPYDIWNQCKQIYVFRYIPRTKTMLCLKSS